MNKILPLLLIVIITVKKIYSQCDFIYSDKANGEIQLFEELSKANINSDLSIYLKKYLTPLEIATINNFKTHPNTSNTIRIRFDIDKTGWFNNWRVYTGNNKLDKKIQNLIKAYINKKYPNLKEKHRGHHYLQLFSKQGAKVIVNASKNIVTDLPPTFKSCENLRVFIVNDCLGASLHWFFERNFDKYLWKNEIKQINPFKITIECDEKGKIVGFIPKQELSEESSFEFKKVLSQYSNQYSIKPAFRNSIPIKSKILTTLKPFTKRDDTPKEIIAKNVQNAITKHFRKHIGDKPEDLNDYFLNIKPDGARVYFTFKKNGFLHKVWNDAGDNHKKELKWKLWRALNDNAFLNSINLKKSPETIYSIVFLRKINGVKKVVCNSNIEKKFVGIYTPCENCDNVDDILHHNKSEIQSNFLKALKKSIGNDYKIKIENITDKKITKSISFVSNEKKFRGLLPFFTIYKNYIIFSQSIKDKTSISKKWNKILKKNTTIKSNDFQSKYSEIITNATIDISLFHKPPTFNGETTDYTINNNYYVEFSKK